MSIVLLLPLDWFSSLMDSVVDSYREEVQKAWGNANTLCVYVHTYV